jgi:membrane-associated phospholipid phosphatase
MNNQIFFFFYNLAHQSAFFDKLVVFFAVYFPYIVILLAGIFLLFHHEVFSSENPLKAFIQKWKEIVLVFFSGAFAWFLAYVLKYLFHTGRPVDIFSNIIPLISKTDYSFPSGHATFFMALAIALFFSHKKVGYIFLFFAFLIGVARIIAGVHFPIDILGGFILGLIIAFFLKNS